MCDVPKVRAYSWPSSKRYAMQRCQLHVTHICVKYVSTPCAGPQKPAPPVVMKASAAPRKPISGRYIIKFKSNGNVDEAVNEISKGNGNSAKGSVKHKYNNAFKGLSFELPQQASAQATENLLSKLKSRADVEYISPDYEVKASGAAGVYRAHRVPDPVPSACFPPHQHASVSLA